jgi:hypothetical protein
MHRTGGINMRYLIIILLAGFGMHQGWDHLQAAREIVAPVQDPHLLPAVALRCEDEPVNRQLRCERDLIHDFETGSQVAESIVRRHCTRFTNGWAEEGKPPSDVCLQIYGGWIEG